MRSDSCRVGPPVAHDWAMSENHDPIRLLAIRETPLSLDEVYAAVGDDAAAAPRSSSGRSATTTAASR